LNLPFFPPQQHFEPATKQLPTLGTFYKYSLFLVIMELNKQS
jgi:hypothetical protein